MKMEDSPSRSVARNLGQSRRMSLLESTTNLAFGFLLAFVVQGLVYPLLGIITTPQDDLLIAGIFTAVSLLRSYVLRRAFDSFRG
jgi:hypothetical protein